MTHFTSQVDRTGAKVTVVEQKEKKDYSFQNNILDLCIECLESGVVPSPEVKITVSIVKLLNHCLVPNRRRVE